IAAAAKYAGDPWEIMKTRGKVVQEAVPMGTVLTLPATGSEMNDGAVINRKEIQTKFAFMNPAVFPQFSILDPTKTYSLPLKQVANGVVDTFVHITEQYLTYPACGMLQDKFSEGLLQILVDIGPRLLEKQDDYDLRANFMWVATWGLNGVVGAGVPQDWTTHMIGHELTALYGIDHAQTLAVVLPSLLEQMREDKKEKLLQYAKNVWGITAGSDDDKVNQAIAKTRAFFEAMGIKTKLSDYGVKPEQVKDVVAQLEAHGMLALGERGNITPEVSRRILENCF
ncbi:MAG: iron-containing alcohol dehydrogenase, partial [Saezia sp.]